jgi:Ca2+-binding RTX toxin-like protein
LVYEYFEPGKQVMTHYTIHAGNSIDRAASNYNPGKVLQDRDTLRVDQDGFIFVRASGVAAVTGGWLPHNIGIQVNGAVISGLGNAIDIHGNNTQITVGYDGFIQGRLGHGGTGIKLSDGSVTNYGIILGDIGVDFSSPAYPGYGVGRSVTNWGEISGNTIAIEGSYEVDVVVNRGVIDGIVRLWGGNDTFVVGGPCSPVYLGDGNDRVSVVFGASHSQELWGEGGNDTLTGGSATDSLIGGAGQDVFMFDFNSGQGWDKVWDFEPAEDVFELRQSKFPNLASGALQNFAHQEADLAGPGIIYTPHDGLIYYDGDGAGGAVPVLFAWAYHHPSASYPNITREDFYVL